MYKFKSLLLIGLVVAVAACGGQAPTTPVAPPTAVVAVPPTATTAAPPTAAAAPTQPGGGLSVTPAGVSSPPKLDPAGMCKATGAPQPVPNFPATHAGRSCPGIGQGFGRAVRVQRLSVTLLRQICH